MLINERTNVRQFLEASLYFNLSESIEEISKSALPKMIGNYLVPESLDSITFGNRLDLSEISNDNEFMFAPLEILAKMDRSEILLIPVMQVIRFGLFVTSEIARFNERDETTLKYNFDESELKAGIKKVSNGVFGLIDVIAKRMNISHDAVLELSQSKVYMMLKIDIDNANYQKNLRDVLSK